MADVMAERIGQSVDIHGERVPYGHGMGSPLGACTITSGFLETRLGQRALEDRLFSLSVQVLEGRVEAARAHGEQIEAIARAELATVREAGRTRELILCAREPVVQQIVRAG